MRDATIHDVSFYEPRSQHVRYLVGLLKICVVILMSLSCVKSGLYNKHKNQHEIVKACSRLYRSRVAEVSRIPKSQKNLHFFQFT